MTWTTLTVKVTTPLFNDGVDPAISAGDGTGVRVASIRGAMRFWFRALAGAQTGEDLPLLAALERRVFGGIGNQRDGRDAAVPSALVLRLPSPPAATRQLALPRNSRDAASIGYLMGLGLMRPGTGGVPVLERPCVAPGAVFKLKIRFQHDPEMTAEGREAVEVLAYVSLWLTCAYGGIGARTRRGFGGVRIVDVAGRVPGGWRPEWLRTPRPGVYAQSGSWLWPFAGFRIYEQHLPELVKAVNGTAGPLDAWTCDPPFPVLSRKYSPMALAPGQYDSWDAVLAHAGRQLRLFRANRPENEARRRDLRVNTAEWDEVINGNDADFPLGALGLPVGFHDKKTKSKLTVNAFRSPEPGSDEMRRASPLWLRPIGSDGSWRLLTFAFQTSFLPRSAGVRLVPDQQATRHDWTEDDLFVDPADVTRLVSQWLAGIRDGADFTRTIRE